MISPVLGYNTMAHTMKKHRWIWAIPVTPRRARRTGFYLRVGVSCPTWLRPFALPPPRCPKPSLTLTSAVLALCPRTPAHNARRYDHHLAGGPGPIWVGYADFHGAVNLV